MPKRTFNQLATALVSQNTRSKRPRLQPGLKYTTSSSKFPWISATKTFNYMNDDPLIDWLENSGYQNRGRSQSIDNNVTTCLHLPLEHNLTYYCIVLNQPLQFLCC